MSPLPELQQLALNFLATSFSRHPAKQRPSFSRHGSRSSSVGLWALYVALSSLTLSVRQPIRPSTTDEALSAPLYAVMGPFYLHASGWGRGFGVVYTCSTTVLFVFGAYEMWCPPWRPRRTQTLCASSVRIHLGAPCAFSLQCPTVSGFVRAGT